MNAADIKGRAVISVATGARLGRVDEVLLDPTSLARAAFRVMAAGQQALMPFAQVQSLGTDAVMVPGDDVAQWVTTYADPGFEELAVTLERLLDQHASDVPAVRTAYRRAMQLEVGFFEAAWRGA